MPTLPLVPLATVSAPLSYTNDIALIDENVACVGDSFELQVHCLARSGQTAGVFGQEGEGPGEFRTVRGIERTSKGTVGVIDTRLDRVTVFSVDGKLQSETSLPGGFLGSQLIGDQVFGLTIDFSSINLAEVSASSTGDRREAAEATAYLFKPTLVSIPSREIVWSRNAIEDAANADCLVTGSAAMAPTGSLVFSTCTDDLVVFEDKDGAGEARRSPAYVEELPNDRDTEEYVEGMARIGGARRVSIPPSVRDAYAGDFRNQPKRWYLGSGPTFRFDGLGRIWAATSRDRSVRSYIEVWDGPKQVGTVTIRDRLLGYDLLDDVLVALVERPPGPEGISQRAIDWYTIPDIP